MRVLIACEFSGIVRDAFAARGHDAWSCDLLPTERSGNHIQGDVLDILDEGWDLMIAHPPCTYLCSSGLHWNGRVEGRDGLTHEAMLFVFNLMGEGFIDNSIPKIALENPIGRISTAYRKPDQVIKPHQFGEDASKTTCLWLKNLKPLIRTETVEARVIGGTPAPLFEAAGITGVTLGGSLRWQNQTDGGQNKLAPSDTRWMDRSRTYQGIANAMADQWG